MFSKLREKLKEWTKKISEKTEEKVKEAKPAKEKIKSEKKSSIKTKEKSCTYQLQPKTKQLIRVTIIPYLYYFDYDYKYNTLYNNGNWSTSIYEKDVYCGAGALTVSGSLNTIRNLYYDN